MLAIVGLVSVLLVLFLIMSKKMTTMMALIVVPVVACIIVGQAGEMGGFITSGIKSVAATGTMFIFAVAFFGLMGDTGTFERIVNKIIHWHKSHKNLCRHICHYPADPFGWLWRNDLPDHGSRDAAHLSETQNEAADARYDRCYGCRYDECGPLGRPHDPCSYGFGGFSD